MNGANDAVISNPFPAGGSADPLVMNDEISNAENEATCSGFFSDFGTGASFGFTFFGADFCMNSSKICARSASLSPEGKV